MDNENIEQEVVETQEQSVDNSAPKTEVTDDGTYKVDFSNVQEVEQEPEQQTQEEPQQQQEEEVQAEKEEFTVLEEVTEEEPVQEDIKEEVADLTEEVNEAFQEQKETGVELPENIQKVVDFMNETGGTLDDYVRLNADYSSVDNDTLLKEYYKQTKSHLTNDEVNFLMEDNFSFDEDIDEERDIKRKKLAYKEEVAKAKNFLEDLKGKYYDEIKLGSRLAPEQQKAIDFFNRYNSEQSQAQELQAKQQEHFKQETGRVFNENFKGFDFNVGDKKYRFNVKDAKQTMESQSDVLKVFSKYVDSNNMLTNAKEYHKSLFAARNADQLANHFYEQGKADAISQMTSEAKNVNLQRKTSDGYVDAGGLKVKVISGETSASSKLKLKNY